MKLLFAVRNVAAHAAEMGGAAPADPVFFLKPPSSVQRGPALRLPTDMGAIHYEVELAIEIERRLRRATASEASAAIGRVGVVLDLTARDLQAERKKAGLPWMESKGFDGACVLGPLVDAPDELASCEVELIVNGASRQRFAVGDYQVAPADLVARASRWITLEPGDILGCGTGAGVGPLHVDDELEGRLHGVAGTVLEAHVADGPPAPAKAS